VDIHDELKRWWDSDAATYDRAATHGMRSPTERVAWTAALLRALPAAPATILDVGAGTGFLSIAAARLGFEVTSLDLSSEMLARLRENAAREDVTVTTVEGPAEQPPDGPFDAVMERHLLWTLPDPAAALKAWRAAAPEGRLVVFEGLWGSADRAEEARARIRTAWRQLRKVRPDHHASYDPAVRAGLPLAKGTHPDALIDVIESAGWNAVAIERLRDVEWARLLARPRAERALGTTPIFVITAR